MNVNDTNENYIQKMLSTSVRRLLEFLEYVDSAILNYGNLVGQLRVNAFEIKSFNSSIRSELCYEYAKITYLPSDCRSVWFYAYRKHVENVFDDLK